METVQSGQNTFGIHRERKKNAISALDQPAELKWPHWYEKDWYIFGSSSF